MIQALANATTSSCKAGRMRNARHQSRQVIHPVMRAIGVLCLAGTPAWSSAQSAEHPPLLGLRMSYSLHDGHIKAGADDEDVAQDALPATPLRLSTSIGAPNKQQPIYLDADRMAGQPGVNTQALGNVRLRQANLLMKADQLNYTDDDNTVNASGNVSVTRNGDRYSGPELQLRLDTYHGYFLSPQYYFARTDAGGHARRIDFVDEQHVSAYDATYTSCVAPAGTTLPWLLSTSRIDLNFDTDIGQAQDAVVRFYGVPILAAPSLTFPLSDARKSGWLPPSFDINNKSGFDFSIPYYWNIAPNRDATLTPTLSTRRGPGLDTEFRYLHPHYNGVAVFDMLPNDRVEGQSRWLASLQHSGVFNQTENLDVHLLRVSDDDYWKDFSRDIQSITPRLLASNAVWQHPIDDPGLLLRAMGATQTATFVNVQSWQALQDLDATDASATITPPFSREPQIGLNSEGERLGWRWVLDTGFTRFVQNDSVSGSADLNGDRLHVLASSWRVFQPIADATGWTVTPKLSLNGASYQMDGPMSDGRRSATRWIPTMSIDSNWLLQKDSSWLGEAYTQTLEPHLLYVNTPYRDQLGLPNFDSAALDFNDSSIFSDNAFSGVDRVADLNELTAGVTTRLISAKTGAEAMRIGVAQRTLFRDQRITDDGVPLTQHLSDILLLASASFIPHWTADGTLQYSPEFNRTVRGVMNVRYSPGPWRTVNMSYRYTKDTIKQLDFGWQWPIAGPATKESDPDLLQQRAPHANASCAGSWYAVGHTSYSLRDRRLTNSIAGFEYDAGCWIGRVVAERVSTGTQESSTRLLFQLELIGLSRLGSSPLKVLKENIPGYRLLREDDPNQVDHSSTNTPFYPFNDD